jgi:hypothetical protein
VVSVIKQTLLTPSISKPVGTAKISTIFAQLIFTNYTINQRLRIEISLDGNNWSSAHEESFAIIFTPEQLQTLSNNSLIPAINYEMAKPGEVHSLRMVWVEGDGTLDIIWRLS